jgi:hypothetical protein
MALVVVGSALWGCAHPQYKINALAAGGDWSIAVVDKRADAEKSSEVLSHVATNCLYGIARLGDDRTVPDRMSYLRAALNNMKHSTGPARTATVTMFAIHRNHQAETRGGLPRQGAIGGALHSLECFASKEYPGGYDAPENPTGGNVAIVVLSMNIAGKTFTSRIVKPAPGTGQIWWAARERWEKVIAAAIDEAIRDIVSQAQI